MKNAFLFLLAILFIFPSCNDFKEVIGAFTDGEDDLELEEGQGYVEGYVELPEGVLPSEVSITTAAGSYEVNDDGYFVAAGNELEKQAVLVENKDGEVLMAALLDEYVDVINARTTARAIIGLAPWTADLSLHEVTAILNDLSNTDRFLQFQNVVQEAIKAGKSPLSDTQTLEALLEVFQIQSLSIKSGNLAQVSGLPEVAYLIEPRINYANGNMQIRNDGTTTSTWGVEVFNKDGSITGNLLLEPNKVHIPSISSLLGFGSGNPYFTPGDPLNLPLQIEDKYKIQFASPTRFSLNPDLSFEAARYNVYGSIFTILKAFGISAKGKSVGDWLDVHKCQKDIIDGMASPIIEACKSGSIDNAFYFDQMVEMYKGMTKSVHDCPFMYLGSALENADKVAQYMVKLGQFLNVYEKLEASFITGKLVGDMLVLNDIEVCRQILDGKMYPCFSLVENPDLNGKTIENNLSIYLDVSTNLDVPGNIEYSYPVGAPIQWEVTEGNGVLNKTVTNVEADGMAEVRFTAGTSENYEIKAFIKDSKGNELDYVTYQLKGGIDSTEIYEQAVLGEWTVNNYNEDGVSHIYTLVLFDGGDGRYIVEGPNGANKDGVDENGNSYYNVSWSIVKSNGRYFLKESGFWHYGYESYRTYDLSLEDVALTFPVTSFKTYTDFGTPSLSRLYVKN